MHLSVPGSHSRASWCFARAESRSLRGWAPAFRYPWISGEYVRFHTDTAAELTSPILPEDRTVTPRGGVHVDGRALAQLDGRSREVTHRGRATRWRLWVTLCALMAAAPALVASD